MSSNHLEPLSASGGAPGQSPPELDRRRGMRVVAIVPYACAVTGGVQADLRIAEELRQRGWDVEVVSFADGPDSLAGRSRRAHLEFNLRLFRHYSRVPKSTIFLEDEALSNTLVLFNWFVKWRGIGRTAVVAHHLSYARWRHPVRRLYWRCAEGFVLRHADVVFADSESTQHDLLALGVEGARVRVVRLAAEPRSRPWPAPRRSAGDRPLRLLTVGTVEPRKGVEYLIRALAHLLDCRWHLDVAGSAEAGYLASLLQAARSAGVVDRIDFLGRVSDERLAALFSEADIMVHPSLWEGFGLAVLEGMQAGLPVIASRVGGLPELIDDERTGLLVAPANPVELSLSLRRLLSDAELRWRLGQAAAEATEERYSWDKVGDQIDSALESL